MKLFKCATYTTNLPLSSPKLREFKRFRLSIRPSQCLNPLRSCALYSFLFCIFAVYFRSFFFLFIDFASTASPVSDNYVLWHYFGTFLNFRLGFFCCCCCCLGYIHFCMSTSNNNTHNNGNAETQLRSIPQWKMVIVFRFLWKRKKYGHHKND